MQYCITISISYSQVGLQEPVIMSVVEMEITCLSKTKLLEWNSSMTFTAQNLRQINQLSGHNCLQGAREFNKEAVLNILTHFKPTETFQYTKLSSCHPLQVIKTIHKKLKVLRILRTNSLSTIFLTRILTIHYIIIP